jgi:CRP-like cAMP-binding protein
MKSISDIPPRLRLLITIAAIGGFIFIVMGTLAGNDQHMVSLDKLVHAVGYALLGILIVMGLPPVWYLPALVAIAGAGVGLEFAQKAVMPTRKFELFDMLANTGGLLAGMCAGFLIRGVWGYVQAELEALAQRRRLVRVQEGTTIFAEGDPSDCFYMIMEGHIRVIVDSDSAAPREIAILGPGQMLGEMGVVDDEPRSATAIASAPCVLYRVDRDLLHPVPGETVHPATAIARALSARLREANARLHGDSR